MSWEGEGCRLQGRVHGLLGRRWESHFGEKGGAHLLENASWDVGLGYFVKLEIISVKRNRLDACACSFGMMDCLLQAREDT